MISTESVDKTKNLPAAARKTAAKKGVSAKKRKKAKKAQYCWWALPTVCLAVVIIAACALFGLNEYESYGEFRQMKAEVLNQSFYNGTHIDGYDVSGCSLDEVNQFWTKSIETPIRQTGVAFTADGESFFVSVEELGYVSDYQSVISQAWSSGRSGSLEEMARGIRARQTEGCAFEVSRRLFDPAMLRELTDSIAAKYTKEAVDATITNFDFSKRQFTFSPEEEGSYVDAQKLYDQAAELLLNGGGEINVEITPVHPEVTMESVSSRYGMITQAITKASSSTKDRLTNIRLACASINGTVVKPGATFSFNGRVGPRTEKNGYKVATVYQDGEVSEDFGGGICQVSTTLWNAAMKADCELVERHNHSIPVSYVDKGKDATVSYTSQDMKFKNTSSQPMCIVAYVSDSKRVIIEIYGLLPENGEYIKIEGKVTKTIPVPDPIYTRNPLLDSGQRVTTSEGRKGYKATTYRIYYTADGKEIRRETLCTSYYKESAPRIDYN